LIGIARGRCPTTALGTGPLVVLIVIAAFVGLVATDREASGNVVVVRGHTSHARRRGTAHGRANRHRIRESAMRRVEACLDEILAFRLRDERLQFGSGEGVDQASLRDDEKEDLCSGEGGKFVCLKKTRGGMSKKKKKKREGDRTRTDGADLFHDAWRER
jgi:hypothetical protein